MEISGWEDCAALKPYLNKPSPGTIVTEFESAGLARHPIEVYASNQTTIQHVATSHEQYIGEPTAWRGLAFDGFVTLSAHSRIWMTSQG